MESLIAKLKPLRDRIDALTLRERALMFIAVMVVLYMIATNLVFAPLRADQARVGKDLDAKRQQIQALNQKIESVIRNKDVDPDEENRAKLTALKVQLQSLNANLGQMTQGFVSPQEMAKLVEQILLRNGRLQVMKVENIPPTPIGEPEAEVSGQSVAHEHEALVYKHGMRIELRGRYFDIVNYLKALEALDWKVFWGQVRLESEKYPTSKITLVIYTLSGQPGWIGV